MKHKILLTSEWILHEPLEMFVYREVDSCKNRPTRKWAPLKVRQVSGGLVKLFREGLESAYIARYKSDIHCGMSGAEIRRAMDGFRRGIELNRKVSNTLSTVILKISKPEDKKKVEVKLKNCKDVSEYNEILKEFMPTDKKTKAELARELGLEVYAEEILRNKVVDFASLVCKEMKDEKTVEDMLKVCLADRMNKDENVRMLTISLAKLDTRSEMRVKTELTKLVETNLHDEEFKQRLQNYSDYINSKWKHATIRDHQVSALNRCTEEQLLTWKVELPRKDATEYHPYAKKKVHWKMQEFYDKAFDYSIDKFFIPKVERIAKNLLNNKSEDTAIEIFGRNIEQLFTRKGINSRFVIALDPGSIVKAAFLRPNGAWIATGNFGFDGTQFEKKGERILVLWADQCRNNKKKLVFAIGNGHNSHNTQKAVVEMIRRRMFPDEIDAGFCVVPEHGASKYSCTPLAEEEFGNRIDVQEISAISIGRRLIDPISEYVKIEPQHLGKGQYQLSANKEELRAKLAQVVRDRVSQIGADLNTASKYLLQQVCGLDVMTASAIVKYREENGGFRSREELKRVDGINEDVYRLCSGFLRVSNPGPPSPPSRDPWKRRQIPKPAWMPLDSTAVHPDDYISTLKLLKKFGLTMEEATDGRDLQGQGTSDREARIIELLTKKPELRPPPSIQKDVLAQREIQEGVTVTGTVSNRTEFGVFVDFGYEDEGLCHIHHFIDPKLHTEKDPRKKTDVTQSLPSVHDVLEFVVIGVENGRISLEPREDWTTTGSEEQNAEGPRPE